MTIDHCVAWAEWTAAAFERARGEGKPVLLFLATAWSPGSGEMDATSYADPEVIAFIRDRFVAVRVDADERPDIADRYALGGVPTTAFLDADGAILGGGTYVGADRMLEVLRRAADSFAGRCRPGRRSPGDGGSSAGGDRSGVSSSDDLIATIFSSFDAEHGGFGTAPKFPLVAPVRLALELFGDTGDTTYERIAVTSLDAMGWGGLYDDVDGGFYHYASTRDWQQPQTEKLLDINAALIDLYLDAGERLGVTRFTERASDALRYVQEHLSDPDGGWRASDHGEVQLVDAAGRMASAALHAARVLDDQGMRQFALTSLERVLLGGYRPGHGVAHVAGSTGVRGLLTDHAAMIAAQLDAFEVSGNVVYEMMAEELAHYALRVLWDGERGGFFDAVEDAQAIGLLRQRLKPFALNCDLAGALARLSRTSGDSTFLERARATLEATAPLAPGHGPLGAHWLLASRDVEHRQRPGAD